MGLLEFEFILMRHGRTRWNQEKRYVGHTDVSLLPEGLTELALLRKQLVELEISKVYCSDLIRCRETLSETLPTLVERAVYDSRLREMDFGDWEGHSYDELQHIQHYRDWLDDPQHMTPPNGEAWTSFASRIADFLRTVTDGMESQSELNQELNDTELKVNDLYTGPKRILIVTHGALFAN